MNPEYDAVREATPASPPAPDASGAATVRPRRLRRAIIASGFALALAGAGGFGAVTLRDASSEAAAETTPPAATEQVVRRDLAEYEEYDGSLGYGDASSIIAGLDGILTGLPAAGDEIGRGETLYDINGTPVVALIGSTPAWRELSPGATPGDDIRQLEENLAALGFDPDGEMLVDQIWDDATTAAVKRWERSLGLPDDGVVALGRVVFLPEIVQVASLLLGSGDAVHPGTPVMDVIPTSAVVTATSQFPYDVSAAIVEGLVEDGSAIERGQELYRYTADDGIAWDEDLFNRELSISSSAGRDIWQLEENLAALGYDPLGAMTIDETYDSATAAAVARWERDLGLTADGVFEPDQIDIVPDDATIVAVALIGENPVTRQLSTTASAGDDIRDLEANLAALGYDAGGALTVDGIFDAATAEAVSDWEQDLGMTPDGIVVPGQVVMMPSGAQVNDVFAIDGDRLGRGWPILELVASQRIVTMSLPVDEAGVLEDGDTVEIELPDGTTVSGDVVDIANVARDDPATESSEATVAVTILPEALPIDLRLSETPVEIHVVTDLASGVLAVPVEALLALGSGGYAVEVAEGGTTRLLRVEIGDFADGWVEVTGDGLTEGMDVVVPS